MSPAAIIKEAAADGVSLTLSSTGALKAAGEQAAVNRWLPTLREHKIKILEVLQVAANDTYAWGWRLHFIDRNPIEVYFSPAVSHAEALAAYPGVVAAEPLFDTPKRGSPLTPGKEVAIRAWLAHIDETDSAIIGDVLRQCRTDVDAREYFTRRAEEVPPPIAFAGDQRRCNQCANLTKHGLCLAARRGKITANRTYKPIRDLPKRCEGYQPGPSDPDRRTGVERWPGLTANKCAISPLYRRKPDPLRRSIAV